MPTRPRRSTINYNKSYAEEAPTNASSTDDSSSSSSDDDDSTLLSLLVKRRQTLHRSSPNVSPIKLVKRKSSVFDELRRKNEQNAKINSLEAEQQKLQERTRQLMTEQARMQRDIELG